MRRDDELISIIPRDRRRAYDVRRILNLVFDRDSFFEIGHYYGRPVVAGLARLDGYPVGVIANDPRQGGGAPNAPACDKMIRLVDLCDTFHIPVVNFVDNPGFLIGSAAERAGTVRAGARALVAVYQATMPWISILIRRCYGVAGAGHGNAQALNLRYAWPSGDWGSLPIEGGVQAAYKRDIEASPDPDARRREIETSLNRFRSPLRTAEAFGVEEIIDPRDTRPLLCEWVRRPTGCCLPSWALRPGRAGRRSCVEKGTDRSIHCDVLPTISTLLVGTEWSVPFSTSSQGRRERFVKKLRKHIIGELRRRDRNVEWTLNAGERLRSSTMPPSLAIQKTGPRFSTGTEAS